MSRITFLVLELSTAQTQKMITSDMIATSACLPPPSISTLNLAGDNKQPEGNIECV